MDLNVIVSGRECRIGVTSRRREVGLVAKKALVAAGYPHDLIDEWEMRDVDGRLLEYAVLLTDYDIRRGQTLYLSPRAGVGA